MYITKQEVLDLKREVQTELDDYVYIRKKHKLVIEGEERIVLLYTVELLDKILIMLKRGNYIKSELLDALRQQNWTYYSFSSKSLWSDKLLRKRLQIKPTKTIMVSDMLKIQAEYLEQASEYIISMLEED